MGKHKEKTYETSRKNGRWPRPQENQDDYRAGELPGDAAWVLVCDGMGGARGGREASQSACNVIERCFQEQYAQCMPGEEEAF